ncbi:hypothetical protein SFHH103_psfHH103d_534 (plasmid) [Sinorhizobium fredii HH103]|nr:hypothetical protein SFHH103_04581 [Sinorhizobium fredii HH103]CEO91741.1 hypothetical protein SFHH103_psfHH103d_534 [Sinorhizobium fredii HH103]
MVLRPDGSLLVFSGSRKNEDSLRHQLSLSRSLWHSLMRSDEFTGWCDSHARRRRKQ